MKILVGMTGSVATTVAHKIVKALSEVPQCEEVRVVMTEKATRFMSPLDLERKALVRVYADDDEWTWDEPKHGSVAADIEHFGAKHTQWCKDDPILHIELAKWASVFVVAPATANTIAKMAHGICDNLLTSVYAAWHAERPVVVAPAMNTHMLTSRANQENCGILKMDFDRHHWFVDTTTKGLACGDLGDGALADASDIAKTVQRAMRWNFPFTYIGDCSGVPVGNHPGAFGARRKHDRHCGVDLYCQENRFVYAVEDGVVVAIEDFTGPAANCPWWLPTKAVKVEGATGVVGYGEIVPNRILSVGDFIRRGCTIGHVTPVLHPGKERGDIPGHSRSMLHLQLYRHGTVHKDHVWETGGERPDNVVDPTPMLLDAKGAEDIKQLDMP